ncbi:MAG: carboxypeptidase regulatory-like domain-containing protein [Rubrivivax sp.]|nr:carboxypeptidase regulatory-like domain-containing protein [Rubrivivax sp.]
MARTVRPLPALLGLLLPVLGGCTLVQLGSEADAFCASTVLVGRGAFFGYVAADAGTHDAPAGSFRRAHETIRIRSVVLAGAGVRRVLQPRAQGTEEWLQRYARGEDDAVGAAFSFVGLPEGEYHLVIEAEGYLPHRSRHVVVPGRAPPFTPIVMQPLPG